MMLWLYIFLSPGHLEKSTEVVTDEIIWCVEFASKQSKQRGGEGQERPWIDQFGSSVFRVSLKTIFCLYLCLIYNEHFFFN